MTKSADAMGTTPLSEQKQVAPAGRGSTTITDRVVAKISAEAAREALRQAQASPANATADARAAVDVRRPRKKDEPCRARIRIRAELGYPVPIGTAGRAVRHQVTERVSTLTGMDVRSVAVRVDTLHPADDVTGREHLR